jgi:hypothetical protein
VKALATDLKIGRTMLRLLASVDILLGQQTAKKEAGFVELASIGASRR